MEGTEDDAGLEVDHRVTGDGAVVGGFEDAFGGGLDEFLGDDAADDLVDDFFALLTGHAGGGRVGFELDFDVTVLAATTRLADELADAFGGQVDGLAVGNLGLAGLGLDLELALEAVDDDFEVKLTHAGDEGLARLGVGGDAEGRIFLSEALQADGETLLVTLGVGLDGHRDDGLGEGGLLEDQVVFGGEGVAGGDVLRADDRADVTGVGDVDFFAVHRTEEDDARDALVLAGARIVEGFTLLELAAVHAVEDELADVRVGPELEAEAGDLGLVVRTDGDLLLAVVDEGLLGAHVDRGGQEVDDAVEEHLDALVLESGTRDDTDEVEGEGGLTDAGAHLVDGHFLAVQVLGGEHVVEVGEGLDQLGAPLLGFFLLVLRDVDRVVLHALRVGLVVDVGDVLDQVDHALELFALADRDEERVGVALELGADVVDGAEVIGTGAVHLVDEGDARDAVLVHLAPDGLGLGLHAGDGAEDGDGAVKDAERALHLGREVHVTGGVDDVDAMVDVREMAFLGLPAGGDGGRGDRDATLALLLHPVGGGGAVMDFAHLVHHAGVEEDALRGGRLAGVDVRGDADVARVLERERAVGGVEFGKFGHGRNRLRAAEITCGLPLEVGEGTVGLGHLVRLFALLHHVAGVVVGVDEFGGEGFGHRGALAAGGGGGDPAQRDAVLALRGDFDRDLVGGATDATALHFELRAAVLEGAEHQLDGVALHQLFADLLDRAVDDALGDGLLAGLHHDVDELADEGGAVTGVREVGALGCFATTRHDLRGVRVGNGLGLLFLRALDAVLGTGATTLFDAGAVERAADDVVAHAGEILHAAAADEDDGVLLELVAFVGDVGDDFLAVRQAHLGDLTLGRVRLLRRADHDLHADAAAEGRVVQGRRLRLGLGLDTRFTDELVDGRHGPR